MLKREMYLSRIRGFYDSDLVKILVGIRRCGKSVILEQIIEEIKEKNIDNNHIIYVNFEIKATAIPLALDYGSRLPKVYILCYTDCVNI